MDAVAEGRNPAPDSLWRRYSEFELLRNYLIVTYPYIVAPPLPEKRVSSVCILKDTPSFDFIQVMSHTINSRGTRVLVSAGKRT